MAKKISLLVIVLAIALWAFWMKRDRDAVKYPTVQASRGDIVYSVSATGRVMSTNLVNVGAEVSGTIKKINVEPNTPVRAGEVLLELDREKLEAQLSQARAGVEKSKAALARAGTELAQARDDFIRAEDLFARGLVSKADYDSKTHAHDAKKAQEAEAKAELTNSLASMRRAEDDLSKTMIVSPMNGVVLTVEVEEGQTVAASFQTPVLLTVANLREMEMHAFVDEADVGMVRPGEKAIFYVDSYPDKEFRGVVKKIYYSPTIEQNVVTYETILSVGNEDLLLRHGMTANIKIIIEERKNALLIPSKALRARLKEETAEGLPKGPSVLVLEGVRPERRPVETGISDEENTEIIKGLKEGDKIILESEGEKEPRRRRFYGF